MSTSMQWETCFLTSVGKLFEKFSETAQEYEKAGARWALPAE